MMYRKTPSLISYICGVILSTGCAVPDAKQTLEYRLEKDLKVKVLGDVDEDSLRTLERVLRRVPYIDACDVILYNSAMWATLQSLQVIEKNTEGCYFSSTKKTNAQIWLPKPVDQKIVIHEFAHRRTQALGDEYILRWKKVNTHEYGVGTKIVDNFTVWIDGTNEVRYGFTHPYGRKNAKEDIATMTAFVRYTLRENKKIRINKESASIILKKIDLLKEGQFIHTQEAYEVQCWLRFLLQKK